MKISPPRSFHFVGRSAPEGVHAEPGEVLARARAISAELSARGIGRGDRVALWLTGGADQLAAILGSWMAGAAFCMLPSYAGRAGSDLSRERVEGVLSVLEPALLIQNAQSPLPDAVSATLDVLTLDGTPAEITDAPAKWPEPRDPEDLAFIQFTSGSTGGKAKGAEVRFGQLEANMDALTKRIGMTAEDRMVSWAPLYHDMGLMAVLISLRNGSDLVLMETDHFVRRPTAWLETISRFQGSITTAPPTALKLLSHRRAKDVNVSSLRYGWIGGEAVFPAVIETFADCYEPYGLSRYALQPTYGMAETVVGVSCGPPGAPWRVQNGTISCGEPIDGMEVRIAGEAGDALPEGAEGRVLVRGHSTISGYLGLPRFEPGGWYDTGDLGFLSDGWLYVSGRVKDVLKRGAESFTASMVETIAEDALELRTGRAAAFASFRPDLGKEEIVLLIESRDWDSDRARQVAGAVMQEIGLQIDVIRDVKGGRLPRTSSGKLMRQAAAAQYREGNL